jgi:hypothetical protein
MVVGAYLLLGTRLVTLERSSRTAKSEKAHRLDAEIREFLGGAGAVDCWASAEVKAATARNVTMAMISPRAGRRAAGPGPGPLAEQAGRTGSRFPPQTGHENRTRAIGMAP